MKGHAFDEVSQYLGLHTYNPTHYSSQFIPIIGAFSYLSLVPVGYKPVFGELNAAFPHGHQLFTLLLLSFLYWTVDEEHYLAQ